MLRCKMQLSDINQSRARPSCRMIYADTANIRSIVNEIDKPQSPMLESRGFRVSHEMDQFARDAAKAILTANGQEDGPIYKSMIQDNVGESYIVSVYLDGNEPGLIQGASAVAKNHLRVQDRPYLLRHIGDKAQLPYDHPDVVAQGQYHYTSGRGDHISVWGKAPVTCEFDDLYHLLLHELVHILDPQIRAVSAKTYNHWSEKTLEASMSGMPELYADLPHELTADLAASAYFLVDKWRRSGWSVEQMRQAITKPDILSLLPKHVSRRYPSGDNNQAVRKLRTIIYHLIESRTLY